MEAPESAVPPLSMKPPMPVPAAPFPPPGLFTHWPSRQDFVSVLIPPLRENLPARNR